MRPTARTTGAAQELTVGVALCCALQDCCEIDHRQRLTALLSARRRLRMATDPGVSPEVQRKIAMTRKFTQLREGMATEPAEAQPAEVSEGEPPLKLDALPGRVAHRDDRVRGQALFPSVEGA